MAVRYPQWVGRPISKVKVKCAEGQNQILHDLLIPKHPWVSILVQGLPQNPSSKFSFFPVRSLTFFTNSNELQLIFAFLQMLRKIGFLWFVDLGPFVICNLWFVVCDLWLRKIGPRSTVFAFSPLALIFPPSRLMTLASHWVHRRPSNSPSQHHPQCQSKSISISLGIPTIRPASYSWWWNVL